jgi:hypothetical protein
MNADIFQMFDQNALASFNCLVKDRVFLENINIFIVSCHQYISDSKEVVKSFNKIGKNYYFTRELTTDAATSRQCNCPPY